MRASMFSAPALAPAAGAACGVLQLGYGVAITIGVLVLVSTVMLASYICFRAKARAARLVDADAGANQSAAVLAGLDGHAIDALYPKFILPANSSPNDDKLGTATVSSAPCAICLGELTAGAALRRGGPGCVHCFHAGCAEQWLRLSATCPVCRDSPVPSPLAAHALPPLFHSENHGSS